MMIFQDPLRDTDRYTVYHMALTKAHEDCGQFYVGFWPFCCYIVVNSFLFPERWF